MELNCVIPASEYDPVKVKIENNKNHKIWLTDMIWGFQFIAFWSMICNTKH